MIWDNNGIICEIIWDDMMVSRNGGTPSHHPFLDGIFYEININKPSSYWGTPIFRAGNPTEMTETTSPLQLGSQAIAKRLIPFSAPKKKPLELRGKSCWSVQQLVLIADNKLTETDYTYITIQYHTVYTSTSAL